MARSSPIRQPTGILLDTASLNDPKTGYTLSYRYWPTSLTRNPTQLQQEWRDWSGYPTQIAMMKDLGMISPATQAINMVPSAPDDLLMKMNQIGDVVRTNSWKMVFAKIRQSLMPCGMT